MSPQHSQIGPVPARGGLSLRERLETAEARTASLRKEVSRQRRLAGRPR